MGRSFHSMLKNQMAKSKSKSKFKLPWAQNRTGNIDNRTQQPQLTTDNINLHNNQITPSLRPLSRRQRHHLTSE
ncbi:unnamed protein product [Ambrosiozyma monospora]|uniref:Unnamed protein product n=1 Tax=Ambrosiozyma monospora TaxID=43982 RepID=A0ACB5SRS2_AMBMO|nr:unnamed protein product [Ambrosiozyma monospora]